MALGAERRHAFTVVAAGLVACVVAAGSVAAAPDFSPSQRPQEFEGQGTAQRPTRGGDPSTPPPLDDCPSGLFSPMPNFYPDGRTDNIVPKGMEHQFTRTSCVVWPYHRVGVLELVGFHPSPRMHHPKGQAVAVNGVPFLSTSPGISLWRVRNAHAGRTSEGTVVFTDSYVFPASHMVSVLPTWPRPWASVRKASSPPLNTSVTSHLGYHWPAVGCLRVDVERCSRSP